MTDRFLERNSASGLVSEKLGLVQSTGSTDAGRLISTGADGKIDPTLMPPGVAADTVLLPAMEALSAGNFIYIRIDGTTPKVAKASAAVGGTYACGFVLDTVNAGQNVLVYFEGRNTGLSGVIPGARYYLSDTTPGGVKTTPVTGAGKLHQFLGMGATTTSINTEMDDPILLAG
jgi:hypothetical protein